MFINLNSRSIFLSIFFVLFYQSFNVLALDIKGEISKTTSADLKKQLRTFVSCCRPNRMVGSKGHLASSKWLLGKLDVIKGNGVVHVDQFKPDIDSAIKLYKKDFAEKIEGRFAPSSYEYIKWKKSTESIIYHLNKRRDLVGKNIVWEKRGKVNPEEILVIGAHYDTIAIDPDTQLIEENVAMPGADDNASGVILALQLIKLLAKLELKKTVVVVFFDFQEAGLLGSKAFVEKYQSHWGKNKFIGFVNLLMLGHDSKATDLSKTHGNMKSYIRRAGEKGHLADKKLYQLFEQTAHLSKSNNKFSLVANSFDSSDIVRFWEKGLPAVVFTQDWENDYNLKRHHTSDDFPETLNFTTLYHSYLYIANGVLRWNFNLLK